jgi:hypothetical protein
MWFVDAAAGPGYDYTIIHDAVVAAADGDGAGAQRRLRGLLDPAQVRERHRGGRPK